MGAAPAMAIAPICGTFERATVNDGALVVQNNAWGKTSKQCVQTHDGGFTITEAQGNLTFGGAPKSYPSIFTGEHYGQGSKTTALPVKVSDIGTAHTSAKITTAPGAWNAAYDIWVNTTPDSPDENDDTEIMIWVDTRGGPTPIGKDVDTITAGGRSYQVWKGTGPGGTDVLTYVDTATTTHPDIALKPFFDDAVARGATHPGSWVTSVQLGFEPWKGGAGLAINDFTYTSESSADADPGDDDQDAAAATGSDRVPADVLDLSSMHLTLPTAGPDGRAAQVNPHQLATFTDPHLFHTTDDGAVLMRAPIHGATTSTKAGATRTELRQRDKSTGDLAAWDAHSGHTHAMTATLRADATHSTDRQELITGQIHSTSSTPPLYLAVDQSPGSDNTLSVYADGDKVTDLLTGITPTTTFTQTITVPGDGTIKVSAAKNGEDKASVSVPASTFEKDTDGWYFKVGAYNKSPTDDGGTGYTQVLLKDLAITD